MKRITQSQDLGTTEAAFNQLNQNDDSKDFFNGQTWTAPTNIFDKWWFNFSIESKLSSLRTLFPHQKFIETVDKDFTQTLNCKSVWGLGETALLWAGIYMYAKKGKIAPIFSQYGRFLKTHRVFRQYLWALFTPYLWAQYSTRQQFGSTVEVLWATHVNRLNNKDLSDPIGTVYPEEISEKKINYRYD